MYICCSLPSILNLISVSRQVRRRLKEKQSTIQQLEMALQPGQAESHADKAQAILDQRTSASAAVGGVGSGVGQGRRKGREDYNDIFEYSADLELQVGRSSLTSSTANR